MRISMHNKQFCLLHQFLNKAVSLLIVFIMIITLSGCSLPWNQKQISETTTSAAEDNADFTEYVNNLFADLLSADMVSLHAYVEHPKDFGINDYEITLGRYDLDNPDDTSDYTDIISTLKSFDRNSLSAKQQITLDELLMYMENELEYNDLYMFNTQLQTTTGIHVQLPLLFAEYTFEKKKDIDEYIELLCDVDGYFENMAAFEKLRADKGYFMEDTLADEVIESCNSFLETAGLEDGAMISTFNEKLASVDGLSSQDIADYKAKNVSAVNEHVIPGYQSLVNALTSLKGSNRYPGGLCNYPDGSRYFEYILSSTLGWSKSVDEYDKLARVYLERRREGNHFDFFHFNVALDNGPCVAKRLAGCGAGHEYYCITADGDIYPCHQFVGREKYKMGTLETGVITPDMVQKFRHTHVLTKPECSKCWARFFCSGGCHANADLINGDITKPYEYGCRLQKKRLENAIIVQAVLSAEAQEGEDLRPHINNFTYEK